MSGERIPFGPGVLVLGGGAVVLSAVMVLGFLLPTDWEATAQARIQASPEEVFAHLDSPEGWQRWTPWPDSGLVREGPERGAGSAIRWDDDELGSGSFRLVEVRAPRSVAYAVEVGGGAMRTTGSVELRPDDGGVRVTWSEEGNLGRNPLMGFWALFMSGAQTAELEKGLERLGALASPPAVPGDDSLGGVAR